MEKITSIGLINRAVNDADLGKTPTYWKTGFDVINLPRYEIIKINPLFVLFVGILDIKVYGCLYTNNYKE